MDTLTSQDYERLARIRMDALKWAALMPEASDWDNAFLIRVIDELNKRAHAHNNP
jgi:hypothetical protein